MRLHIDLPDSCLAWAVAWLIASRRTELSVSVSVGQSVGIRPVGSRLFRPSSELPETLMGFCREHHVPVDLCGQLFLAPEEGTARLLDLFQNAARRRLNVLSFPPEGLRSRYPELSFPQGVRGLLDLEAGVIGGGALVAALRSQAEELGVQSVEQNRPRERRKVRRLIPWRSSVRMRMDDDPTQLSLKTPCLLSSLPELGFPELTHSLYGKDLGSFAGPGIIDKIVPFWRGRFGPAQKLVSKHAANTLFLAGTAMQMSLVDDADELRIGPGQSCNSREPTWSIADAHGAPLPIKIRRRRGRFLLQAPTIQPIDLFSTASYVADQVLELW